jgi:hypothetical protein
MMPPTRKQKNAYSNQCKNNNNDDKPNKEETLLPNIKESKKLLNESKKVHLKENTTVFKDRYDDDGMKMR